ncbi:MAG: tetratricopeptide repeat protein [Rhodospirillales bacterium]|nr:tetratricopeptide repeat protein [Rhodospirillales bacterium]
MPEATSAAPPPSAATSSEDRKLLEGLTHQQENRPELAEAAYQEILAANPNHGHALFMLGLLAHSGGRLDEALDYMARAVVAAPAFANAHLHRGEVLQSMGQLENALGCFDQALDLKPELLDASLRKSQVLQQLGRLDAALSSDQKALSLHPASPRIRLNIALTLRQMGRIRDALFQLDVTLAENPDFTEAYFQKGSLLYATGRLTEALATFDEGIAVDCNDARLYNGKASVLVLSERLDEALACYLQALDLAPDEAQTHSNLGGLYQRLGQGKQAVSYLRRAIALRPDHAEAHQNLAFALFNLNQNEDAFNEFDWRWRKDDQNQKMRAYEKPLWDGKTELTNQKLLLWPEQGPQDVTIWASSLPQIIARTKHCIVQTYPKLLPLYERSFPDAEIRADVPVYDKSQNDFDYHLPMGSLFKYTRPDLNPDQPAYLLPDPGRVAYWQQRLAATGPAPYVGISWKGAVINDNRSPNYTEVADWAPLIHKPATFVNLQCGESASELGAFEELHGVRVHDFEDLDLFDNLDDVAAFAAALDLAISVSTCVSALTAGVGTETWILAWKQSPWNNLLLQSRGPAVTHFERSTGEDWQACFDAMAVRLQALIDG